MTLIASSSELTHTQTQDPKPPKTEPQPHKPNPLYPKFHTPKPRHKGIPKNLWKLNQKLGKPMCFRRESCVKAIKHPQPVSNIDESP